MNHRICRSFYTCLFSFGVLRTDCVDYSAGFTQSELPKRENEYMNKEILTNHKFAICSSFEGTVLLAVISIDKDHVREGQQKSFEGSLRREKHYNKVP